MYSILKIIRYVCLNSIAISFAIIIILVMLEVPYFNIPII